MSEPMKKPEQNPESYSPGEKPVIITLVEKKIESPPQSPAIEIYRARRESYKVLGMENKISNDDRNPNCGECWGKYFDSGTHEKVVPFMAETPLLGVFCQSDPGYYNYLIGAVVSGVDEAPEGMFLAEFPATDYLVVTHEWVKSEDEANAQIGRLVGHAHGPDVMPDGYEKYTVPVMFIESYNNSPEKSRFEVWLPIREKA